MTRTNVPRSTRRVEVYFVSYARFDDQSGRLEKVARDLATRVAQRLGTGHHQLAFFDKTSIETGEEWEKVIRSSVSTVRLLVCFCSNTFLNSEFCAREFDVFRRRLSQPGVPEGISPVIPVIWDRCELPQAILRFQLTSGTPPSAYLRDGVLALQRLKGQRDAYEKTLAMLTEAIVGAASGRRLPAWKTPVGFEELADAFDNPGEGNVQMVALHPDGMRWVLAPGQTLRRAIEQTTATLRKPWRSLRPSASLAADVEAAHQQGHGVIVVADAETLADSPWRDHLGVLQRLRAPNVRVLVGVGEQAAPPALADLDADAFIVDDVAGFQRALNTAVTRLEMKLIAERSPARVESDALSEAAASQGIDVSSRPPTVVASGEPS